MCFQNHIRHWIDGEVSRKENEGDGDPSPDLILLKADDFLIFNLGSWIEACQSKCVNAAIMICGVREVFHPLCVVGALDEAFGCEAICAEVDETSECPEDEGGEKVPQNLVPCSIMP